MFKWLRARVREAFLAGCQDAIDALSLPADGPKLDLPKPALLRLPAADEEDDAGDDAPTPKRRAK